MAIRFRSLSPAFRIVAAALTFALVLVVAVGVIAERGAASRRDSAAAKAANVQNATIADAVTTVWQEREAMAEYLATGSPADRDEVGAKRRRFEAVIAAVQRQASPDEVRQMGLALTGNRLMVALFNSRDALLAKYDAHVTFALLSGAEAGVFLPLGQLVQTNARKYAQDEGRAQASAQVAVYTEILSGCLVLAAGIWFVLFSVRLIRRNERQNSDLLAADRVKDEFVRTVSHELRTPITSVQGYVEMLLDEDGDPLTTVQRGFLTTVHRSAARLLRLVNDLLLSAEVIAGKLSLKTQRVELVELVRIAVEGAHTTAAKQTLGLTFIPSMHNLWVEADSGRIGQAIDNLLSNALKFTPAGGQVSVAVAVAADDRHAAITITDTGMGMSRAEVGKLFTAFYRTDAAETESIQGTGLGLTITQAIVTAHGGTITVQSEPGAGTSFVITLPLSKRPAEPSVSTKPALLANAH
jgi:signal transduction histidine kinase